MAQAFIDTNIPMYAAGMAHPLREPSQRVILAIVSGRLDAATDAEVFQEILYRYLRVGERQKGFQIFDNFHRLMLGRILPIEDADVVRAREITASSPSMSPRDAIHLAIVQRYRIPQIVTADRGFDAVGGVSRLDPAAFTTE